MTEPSELDRMRLLLAALPRHAFLCGPTAAAVLGIPLPRSLRANAFVHPTVGVPLPANRVRRPGVTGRALRVQEQDVTVIAGMRMTSPPRTWRDLSAILSLPALVAATDFAIQWRHPLCGVDDLLAAHGRAIRMPGAPKRRRALELCSDRAESARESELRVALVLAGLPEPDCNVEIFDGSRFVARVDMLYPEAGLVIEYDGEYHNDPAQWSRDQSRRAEIESLGYRYTVVTARDFDDIPALIARIERLLLAA